MLQEDSRGFRGVGAPGVFLCVPGSSREFQRVSVVLQVVSGGFRGVSKSFSGVPECFSGFQRVSGAFQRFS